MQSSVWFLRAIKRSCIEGPKRFGGEAPGTAEMGSAPKDDWAIVQPFTEALLPDELDERDDGAGDNDPSRGEPGG